MGGVGRNSDKTHVCAIQTAGGGICLSDEYFRLLGSTPVDMSIKFYEHEIQKIYIHLLNMYAWYFMTFSQQR